ncbi:MAG TPA: biotin/lipoyl-binding protein [Clostridiales bacterium]|nr:biotin/lipoyl-binding protein [Clostridiales bacterium]
MKKFIVTVNGNSYEVEVEEVMGETSSYDDNNIKEQPSNKQEITSPSKEVESNANKSSGATKKVPAGATTVKAPMPGTILDINVNEGDTVKRGQVLCILEAMKMENEIMSPKDGKIVSINTSKGNSVDAGDILFSIE